MSEADLIPFNAMPKGEHLLMSKRGGQAKTQVKQNEAKWRSIKARMKKKAVNSEEAAWMIERLENRDAIAVDILLYIEEVKQTIHPGQRVALINAMEKVATFQHGAKVKTENLNINVNTTVDEIARRLFNDEDIIDLVKNERKKPPME
jgi:hypothetical protein